MTPDFRQNEQDTPQEKAFESYLQRVRETYGEDIGYLTDREELVFQCFLSGYTVLAATHELEAEFGETR